MALVAEECPVLTHAVVVGDTSAVGTELDSPVGAALRRLALVCCALLIVQLTIAAAMRHNAAGLAIPTYGKTGTSQDSRDALFIGFAGDLVVGVWIGRDDNKPLGGIHGGGLPAQIWREFMGEAIAGAMPAQEPEEAPIPEDPLGNELINALPPVEIRGAEINLDGELAGFADYRLADGDITFYHTEVFPIHRGKNLAAILMEATLKDVRSSFPNDKVVPTCSYVVRFMEKHPETQDLLKDPIEDAIAACELRPRS